MTLKVVTLPGPVVTMAVGIRLVHSDELLAGITVALCGVAAAVAILRTRLD